MINAIRKRRNREIDEMSDVSASGAFSGGQSAKDLAYIFSLLYIFSCDILEDPLNFVTNEPYKTTLTSGVDFPQSMYTFRILC